MMTPTESRRYGLMVRDFTPDEAKAYNDHLLAGKRAEDFFAKMEKHLAGQHDQSTHGSWSDDIFENVFDWADESMMMMGDFETDKEIKDFLATIESQQKDMGYDEKKASAGNALSVYKASGYSFINEQLREPSQPKEKHIENKIDKIDQAIEGAPPLKNPVLAYRGIANQGLMGSFFFNKLKVGDTFQDLGYVSTTLNPKIAATFAGEKGTVYGKTPVEKQGMILQYHLPKGAKGLFLDSFTNNFGEYELLLPRGSKFKVTQIRGKIIDVEIVQ
jgi:hypothetical protein